MKNRWSLLVVGVALLLMAIPAQGLIGVKVPIDGLFRSSRQILVGRISAIAADRPIIDVEIVEAIRGTSPGQKVRIQVVKPEGLTRELAVGGAVALMQDKQNFAIHMGDRWLLAEQLPAQGGPAFRVRDEYPLLLQTFPGRTEALIDLFRQMRTRLNRILNATEDNIFREIKQLGQLEVRNAEALFAADFNGDKKPDLLIQTSQGVRLFLHADGQYRDATAAAGLSGTGLAFAGDANGDGQVDVVAGGQLFLNDGGKFRTAGKLELPPPGGILVAGFVDVSGTKRQDIAVLMRTGQLLIWQNPGAAGQPWVAQPPRTLWPASEPAPEAAAFGEWGDDGRTHVIGIRKNDVVRYALADGGSAPGDILRLTGDRMGVFDRENHGLAGAVVTTFDSNADGRRDLLVVNEPFGLMLVNRGFGAFFASPITAIALKDMPERPVPFRITPATRLAAADFGGDGCDDLVVLTEDGRLYLVDNPPHEK